MNKYLKREQARNLIGQLDLPIDFLLMSQDSYNETMVGEAILKTGKKVELLEAAINIAVVGIGNQKYGQFANGKNVIDVATLLTSVGIKLRLPQGSVLREDELTVGRLCRFYRHHIRDYLAKVKYPTYLWRKYSHHMPNMNQILFRGAEYLDDLTPEEEAEQLFVFQSLDLKAHTNFVDRYGRIKQAQKGFVEIVGDA